MTFDAALELLGIDATASRKDARRAYLKRIKLHKPDRDPEMFRRVREAFELVDEEIEWRQAMAEDDHADDDDRPHKRRTSTPPRVFDAGPADPDASSPMETPFRVGFELRQRLRDGDDPEVIAQAALQAMAEYDDLVRIQPFFESQLCWLCVDLFAHRATGARAVAQAFVDWSVSVGAELTLSRAWGSPLVMLNILLMLPEEMPIEVLGIFATGLVKGEAPGPTLSDFVRHEHEKARLALEMLDTAAQNQSSSLIIAWRDALRWRIELNVLGSSAFQAAPKADSTKAQAQSLVLPAPPSKHSIISPPKTERAALDPPRPSVSARDPSPPVRPFMSRRSRQMSRLSTPRWVRGAKAAIWLWVIIWCAIAAVIMHDQVSSESSEVGDGFGSRP